MKPVLKHSQQSRIKLVDCLKLLLFFCVVFFAFTFSFTQQLDPCASCPLALRGQVPCNNTVVVKEVIRNVNVATAVEATTNSADHGGSLRSMLQYSLQTLPNNKTQHELTHVTSRTELGGKITLVTQGGVSKLPRLVDLVGRWQGPISCALAINTMEHVDDWLQFMNDNPTIQQYVSFHLLLELPQLPANVNRHPINRVRNLALRHVDTEFVFLNDIDFMPPIKAHDRICEYMDTHLLPPKTLWVLPAFERFGLEKKGKGAFVNDVDMTPKTKEELLTMVEAKQVLPFHDYFPPGHAPTDYSKWYSAKESYDIQYDMLFEPYVIARADGLPEYYKYFRGFASNKMTWFLEAHYQGFQFQVMPFHYVVHMNHGGRKGRNDKGGDSHIIRQYFVKYIQEMYPDSVTEFHLQKLK